MLKTNVRKNKTVSNVQESLDFETIQHDNDHLYAVDEQAKEIPADKVDLPDID